MDATDSFTTRLDLNRACIAAGRAWVSGAAIRSEGQLTVFDPSRPTACYRCLYPEGEAAPDLSCSEAGVLSPIVGVIGSLQALEAVKVLSGFGEPLFGTLLLLDGWTSQVRRITLSALRNVSGRLSQTRSRRLVGSAATPTPAIMAHQKPRAAPGRPKATACSQPRDLL